MTTPEWTPGETLAWTKHDGVTPPPRGVRVGLLSGIAASMTAVWIGMIATDALCPDHRMWVQILGTIAIVSAGVAIGGLFGQRAWAPLFALASALLGVVVGFIDAVHSPTRGALISVAFAVVSGVLVVASIPVVRSRMWVRRAAREMNPGPMPRSAATTPGGVPWAPSGSGAQPPVTEGAPGTAPSDSTTVTS